MTGGAARARGLGAEFHRLWAAGALSAAGDGVTLAAAPLLMVRLTSDPLVVAGAVFAQQVPWLLFSLISGVYVDRLDRRKLVVLVNLARAVLIGALAAAVWTGSVGVLTVYTALFLLGTAETLADGAARALVVGSVAPDDLTRANSRVSGAAVVGSQLIAPSLGVWLFLQGAGLPFAFDAATFLVAVALVLRLRPRQGVARPRRSLGADVRTGVRTILGHPALRLLTFSLCLMNATFAAIAAIFVLYTRQRLGLSDSGYGLLLSVGAVGGVAGAVAAPAVQRRLGDAAVLRIGLLVECCAPAAFAAVRQPWLAACVMALFGAHTVVWAVVATTLRQRALPDALYGRANSVHMALGVGGSAAGALLGGLCARGLGVTGPLWCACAAMTVFTAVTWSRFSAGTLSLPGVPDPDLPPPTPPTSGRTDDHHARTA
ncbi:MFS transporter [Kitasatospora sp. NPDC085464]|uniref:MFS transporter n=1 Tax=Kitasatospora sp. NPDC085464 TaxID=3364063 RepID=UPI0037CC78C2